MYISKYQHFIIFRNRQLNILMVKCIDSVEVKLLQLDGNRRIEGIFCFGAICQYLIMVILNCVLRMVMLLKPLQKLVARL